MKLGQLFDPLLVVVDASRNDEARDVIEDLKRVAPALGFLGYQPLARTYIGQRLRADLERLDNDTVSALMTSLKRRGVGDEVIQEALSEVTRQ